MSLFKRTKAVWVLAFVIVTAITLVAPQLNIAAPTPAQAQGGSGPDWVSPLVIPTRFDGSVYDLPAPTSGNIVEVPRLQTSLGRPASTAAGGLDPLMKPNLAPVISLAFAVADRNLDGIPFQGVNPSDPNGDVGPSHFVEMSNSSGGSLVHIYNKATSPVLQTSFTLDTLATGNCGQGHGDPIVLWDSLADRWLLSEFSDIANSVCIYISQTADPTGAYYIYEFPTPNFPDYPKFGVWPDAYYMTTNETGGPALYAFDRSSMLVGAAATAQRFTAPSLDGFAFQALTPADLDGTTAPPAGADGIFMRQVDTEAHPTYSNPTTQDFVEMFFMDVDWVTPANSTLTGPTRISVTEFDSDLCGLVSFFCFPQSGTAITLDPLREVIMWRLAYRNFGTHESIVGNFVTDATGADEGGVRWFELRNSGGGWTLFDEGTYVGPTGTPDGVSRWMGAIAMDGDGNIALGYSASSGSIFPSLRYTGRLATDPAGTMPRGEQTLVAGTGFNGSNRWGDYFSMSIDPSDDCTFWFVGMYGNASNNWTNRIGSFAFDSCLGLLLTDLEATITDGTTSAELGGPISLIITVTNNGPEDVVGAQVDINVPNEIINVTWGCAITTGVGTCPPTPAPPLTGAQLVPINTTVDLNAGATATFTISGIIDPATPIGTVLTSSVTVTPPAGYTDPIPGSNTVTDGNTIIVSADGDGGTTTTGGGTTDTVVTGGETTAPTTLPSTGYAPSDSDDSSSTNILLIVAAGALALSILATSLMMWRKQH